METKNKPVLLNLSQQTIDKLDELDRIRTIEIGRGHNKSQIVRDAIDALYSEIFQQESESK